VHAGKTLRRARVEIKALNPKIKAARMQMRDVSLRKRRSKIMPLVQLLEVLVVVGVLLWLVNRFIPMQGSIKSILNGVVVIAVVLWLLNVFGLFHSLAHIHIGT
jgi:Flp pilus assembly protein TadB